MMILSVAQVAKTFGSLQVLNDISFILNTGDRVGLVGANGAGKSTLLRTITGEVMPDNGAVIVAPGVVSGYLPQQPPGLKDESIDDLVHDAVGDLRRLELRLRHLEQVMADRDADLDLVIAEYGEVLDRYERRGGYDLDYRIDVVFEGLRISHIPRERRFASLSGGEKARVLLATLLLLSPDLLLLDEPTNHLDFTSITWLEEYLATYRGTLLVISHDRHFLDRTVSRIVEIDEHTRKAKEYVGDYGAYQEAKRLERERWELDYAEQQDEIKELRRAIRVNAYQVAHNRPPRDPAKMAYDFKSGRVASAISRNVRAAEERLRRIEADPIPKPPSEMSISPDFDPDTLRSENVVVLDNVTKRYGRATVLDGISFTIGPDDRVVIVGPNGAGKSTLLDIVAGRMLPDHGQVTRARNVHIGYLDQDARQLDPNRTVLETYREGLIGYEDEIIADLFRYGLFTLDDLDKPVRKLSAGQVRKLQVARLIAERANVLLLDEPTNHLSFDILEELEAALAMYPGPILAVSHDRRFIERFRGKVWELRDGQLIQHAEDADIVLAHLIDRATPSSAATDR